MAREPQTRDRRYRTSVGAPVDVSAAVETPSELYPLRSGGRAAPDRSREPEIGPACYETGAQTRGGKRVVVNPETNAGPEVGPVENTKTRQDYGDAVTEARHGQPTRPGRPGGRG